MLGVVLLPHFLEMLELELLEFFLLLLLKHLYASMWCQLKCFLLLLVLLQFYAVARV